MLVVAALLDLLLFSSPSELKGPSASNPPPSEYQCGQYPISLHITDEGKGVYKYVGGRKVVGSYDTLPDIGVIDIGMRVGYMFIDGRVVRGLYHTTGLYGTFHLPQNGNTDGDPWYYFRDDPPEGWIRVMVLDDRSEIVCHVIDQQ